MFLCKLYYFLLRRQLSRLVFPYLGTDVKSSCVEARQQEILRYAKCALPHIFTKGEVDYLVGLLKLVRVIPRPEFLNRQSRSGWLIEIRVFKKGDLRAPLPGLMVMAKAHQAPQGLPHPTPSAALLWHGKRIRGLNREMRHDNPDGTIVRGWHEHLWSPSDDDACVIQAQPEPKDRTLIGILQWGLEKWNIEVEQKQESLK